MDALKRNIASKGRSRTKGNAAAISGKRAAKAEAAASRAGNEHDGGYRNETKK